MVHFFQMIIPPRHYTEVTNPVARAKDGQVIVDALGQVKLNYADTEIRFSGDGQPFPLYPGEVASRVLPLTVVPAMSALRLKVLTDFVDEETGQARIAGDEFLFEGPGTYMPRKEVTVQTQYGNYIFHICFFRYFYVNWQHFKLLGLQLLCR